MTKCKKCNVTVEAGQPRCPLCFAAMEHSGSGDVSYPDYAKAYQEAERSTLLKLLLFLSIAAGSICLMINLFTLEHSSYWWSAIVIISLFISWGYYLAFSIKGISLPGRVLLLYVLITASVLAIDIWTGFLGWSTTYVLPFLTIAVVLFNTLASVRGKAKYRDYFGYLIASLVISIFPLVLFLFSLSDQLWTSIAALLYSVLTVIGLYMFSDREFKIELKKRLHF